MLKNIKIIICVALCVNCFLLTAQNNTPTLSANRIIPKVFIKTLDGETFNTANFSNNDKPIIINFWSTICKPCIKELSYINDLYEEWQEETGVKFIAISTDDSKTIANVLPFINGRDWDFDFYTDVNGDFKRAMNVNLIPHTFILNSKLEIVWQHVSYTEGDELKYIEVVRDILKNQKK